MHEYIVTGLVVAFVCPRLFQTEPFPQPLKSDVFIVGMRSGAALTVQFFDAHVMAHGAGKRYAPANSWCRHCDDNDSPGSGVAIPTYAIAKRGVRLSRKLRFDALALNKRPNTLRWRLYPYSFCTTQPNIRLFSRIALSPDLQQTRNFQCCFHVKESRRQSNEESSAAQLRRRDIEYKAI
jgi:hypothetical protein